MLNSTYMYPARGSEKERCQLPQRGPGRSPAANAFLTHLRLSKSISWQHFGVVEPVNPPLNTALYTFKKHIRHGCYASQILTSCVCILCIHMKWLHTERSPTPSSK